MSMRGLRGATTALGNDKEEIWRAAREMVEEMMKRNSLQPAAIGAAIFSMTEDLTAGFPSTGVRGVPGFELVPLFDARQCAIEGSLARCIRVLLLVDTDKRQDELCHVYLGGAETLRPDLCKM